MLTAIISARESERSLVPTLTALVPGAASGLLRDVIVADARSRDATREVAEIAGCRFMSSAAALGERLAQAAREARGSWLLFLPAGTVLEPGWMAAVESFIGRAGNEQCAAVFRRGAAEDLRPGLGEFLALFRASFGGLPQPEQGLLIAHRFYDALGGHDGGERADTTLLRRIGRRRIAMLRAGSSIQDA